MRIAIDSKPGFTAEQLVDRHIGAFALDVPERLVEPAKRVVQHGAIAPVRAYKKRLPEVFDVVDILTHAEVGHVIVDGRHDHLGALGEGSTADAIQPGFRGLDFYDDQVRTLGGRADRFYGSNGYRGKTTSSYFRGW